MLIDAPFLSLTRTPKAVFCGTWGIEILLLAKKAVPESPSCDYGDRRRDDTLAPSCSSNFIGRFSDRDVAVL